MPIGWSTNIMLCDTSQPFGLSSSVRSSLMLNGPFSARVLRTVGGWLKSQALQAGCEMRWQNLHHICKRHILVQPRPCPADLKMKKVGSIP